MSLMLKLLLSTLLLNSFLYADKNTQIVEEFLEETISDNRNIQNVDISVVDTIKVEELKGWTAYVVDIKAILKRDKREIKQKMVWFSDGNVITKELNMLKSGDSLIDLIKPSFKDNYYTKENLIYGNADAKYKVAIFSDPLCPYCRTFVPKAIKYMKKQPEKFAVYYYHFPLPSIHPAAVELVKAAIAAELKGHKDVVLNLYKVKVKSKEKNVQTILKAFNTTMKTDIKPADIEAKEVLKHYENDLDIADNLMVSGTPTMFFNGVLDRTKRKYEKAK
ncbi:MAG: thioredoxin domain-containing protein [Campylobacterota bacterium]|nr:thioredoxin domain-containing protein [Campylobacterota bacterium]